MSENIVATAAILQKLFNERADELAKEVGFINRQHKLTGSKFVKTLLFGWLQNSPSVEGLVRAGVSHDLHISAQGLDKRFTEKTAEFLQSLLSEAMNQILEASTPMSLERIDLVECIYRIVAYSC
jgi:hypothetical protein